MKFALIYAGCVILGMSLEFKNAMVVLCSIIIAIIASKK
jgi:hypothetical protein